MFTSYTWLGLNNGGQWLQNSSTLTANAEMNAVAFDSSNNWMAVGRSVNTGYAQSLNSISPVTFNGFTGVVGSYGSNLRTLTPYSINGDLYGVANYQSTWVAVGSANIAGLTGTLITYTTNRGTSWSSSFEGNGGAARAITVGRAGAALGRWVAVGDFGIQYTYDTGLGIWQSVYKGQQGFVAVATDLYGHFIAVGTRGDGPVYTTSLDGRTWTALSPLGGPSTYVPQSVVVCSTNYIVVVGYDSATNQGATWVIDNSAGQVLPLTV
jgi:hypothetical protein